MIFYKEQLTLTAIHESNVKMIKHFIFQCWFHYFDTDYITIIASFTRCVLNNAASPSSGKAYMVRGFHFSPLQVQVHAKVLLTEALRKVSSYKGLFNFQR